MLPLHSMVPAVEQRRVFLRPQPGVRKLVLVRFRSFLLRSLFTLHLVDTSPAPVSGAARTMHQLHCDDNFALPHQQWPQFPFRARLLSLQATNIAETAITIDDIVAVIDSGRLKEKSFDPYTSVSTLQVPRLCL